MHRWENQLANNQHSIIIIIIIINKLYLHDLITGIAKRNRKNIKVN
jgi:hypothetical protein